MAHDSRDRHLRADGEMILDAAGVEIVPGQRVLYATAFGSGALQWGTVAKAYVHPRGGGEHIQIRRDDNKHIVIGWARRIVVMSSPTEAHEWLRRQLETLRHE